MKGELERVRLLIASSFFIPGWILRWTKLYCIWSEQAVIRVFGPSKARQFVGGYATKHSHDQSESVTKSDRGHGSDQKLWMLKRPSLIYKRINMPKRLGRVAVLLASEGGYI